jgi:hypothetical protein
VLLKDDVDFMLGVNLLSDRFHGYFLANQEQDEPSEFQI